MRFRAFAAASGLVFTLLGASCLIYGEDLLATGGSGGGGGGTGPGSGGSGATTGTQSGAPCKVAEDCPDPGSPCKTRVCAGSVCSVENAPPNTAVKDPNPGDCHGVVCDTAGGTIDVENSKDAPDDLEFCTFDTCELGQPAHTPKTGFGCSENGGKYCDDHGQCVECFMDSNCTSKVCKAGKCAPSGCSDGLTNGDETDKDCGGSCQGCATGKICKGAADCLSKICSGGLCKPSCTDGQKNNAETDVDCGGGTCGACDDGKICGGAADCKSQVCTMAKCAAPTCADGKKNGAETAVDCGGPMCPSCPLDHIVINEVDYDQLGSDTTEFIEIYNATLGAVSLAGHKLVLIDGVSNAPYAVVDLAPAGSLAAGQYLLVMDPAVMPAGGTLKLGFPDTMNQIQNGVVGGMGSPDGIALIDDSKKKLIDVFSYEGAITTADLSMWGMGTVSLVEGVALSADLKDEGTPSLCRFPNAKDTGSSAADWALCTTPTPGALNTQ